MWMSLSRIPSFFFNFKKALNIQEFRMLRFCATLMSIVLLIYMLGWEDNLVLIMLEQMRM